MLHADAATRCGRRRRAAIGREALGLELEPDHPVCRQLWMQRQELARRTSTTSRFGDARRMPGRVRHADVELLADPLRRRPARASSRSAASSRANASGRRRQLLRTLANPSAIADRKREGVRRDAQLNKDARSGASRAHRENCAHAGQLVQSGEDALGSAPARGEAVRPHEAHNPIGFVHRNLQLPRGVRRAPDACRRRSRASGPDARGDREAARAQPEGAAE